MYQNRERLSKVRDLEDAALMYSRKQLQVEAERDSQNSDPHPRSQENKSVSMSKSCLREAFAPVVTLQSHGLALVKGESKTSLVPISTFMRGVKLNLTIPALFIFITFWR